jgi:hypothetical protein
MPDSRLARVPERRPLLLTVASGIVVLQSLVLVVCGVLVLVNTGGDFAALGVGSAIFFLIAGVGLGACAVGLLGLNSWARAPIVLADLIELGLAWDAHRTATGLAIGLAVLAIAGLACLLSPPSIEALADRPE